MENEYKAPICQVVFCFSGISPEVFFFNSGKVDGHYKRTEDEWWAYLINVFSIDVFFKDVCSPHILVYCII